MIHDISLHAHDVQLTPLHHQHAADLHQIVDSELWAGMSGQVPDTEAKFQEYVDAAQSDPTRLAFAVIVDGEAVGSTSFYELVPAVGRVEIGYTFFARTAWGTTVNPAAKLAMLSYAFEARTLHRVALRCDATNLRSAAAIRKLGGVPEGVLRGHRLRPDGTHGDSAYFSILAPEWPQVKSRLERRLGSAA